jgi:hypothetical protein
LLWRAFSSAFFRATLPLYMLSYDALGNLTQETVSPTASTQWTLNFRFDSAGRFVSETDPGQSAPSQTATYNSYGWLNSLSVPQGSYTNFTFDADGRVLGYSGYGEQVGYGYDSGGHLVTQTFSPNNAKWPGFSTTVRAGFNLQDSTENWDARNGAELSDTATGLTMQYDALNRLASFSGQAPSGVPYSKTNTYDSNDSQTGSQLTNFAYFKPTAAFCGATNGSGDPNPVGTTSVSYTWSAEGKISRRQASANNSVYNEALHWDGDSLEFTQNVNNGTIDDIKVGAIGEISNGTFYIYDRDPLGYVSSTHTSPTAHGSWQPPNPYLQNCVAPMAPAATPYFLPPNPVIQGGGMPVDPVFDGVNVITGARSYEMISETQAQPDPGQNFAGGGTPMSFQDNAPVVGSDPTGNDYCIPDPLRPGEHIIVVDKSLGPDHIDACATNDPALYFGGQGYGKSGTPDGGGGAVAKPAAGLQIPCIIHGGENDFINVSASVHDDLGTNLSFTFNRNGTIYFNVGAGPGLDLSFTAGLGRTFKGNNTQSIDDQLFVAGFNVLGAVGPFYSNTSFSFDNSNWGKFPQNIDVGVEKGVASVTVGAPGGASLNAFISTKLTNNKNGLAPILAKLWCKN